MNLIEPITRKGEMNAYLIDPAWKEKFPTRLPRNQWPIAAHLFQKQNQITTKGQVYSYRNGFDFAYIAGGLGTAPPTTDDVFLQSEQQRFEVTDIVFAAGEINAYAEIPPSTGNLTWQEWGMFLGDANNNSGSGTMYSRLLQTFTKNLGDSVLLTYTLTETL